MTKTELDFTKSVKDKKVPLLVLDQKWHHLFAVGKKPEAILPLENQLKEQLKEQGRAQQELKDLKKVKSTLMNNIMENMDGTDETNHILSKKLDADRRLIDEVNEKIDQCEDTLLEMPKRLKETNDLLMQETMRYCYGLLRTNAIDIEEIGEWIKNIRIELKKQIIKKQSAELKNREIYSYMHDIFGAEMIDVFDLEYQPEEEPENKGKNTESKEASVREAAPSGEKTE